MGNSGGEESPQEDQTDTPDHQYPMDALHIWRDSQTQKLVLQIGDRILRSPEPFSPTEQKYLRHLLNLLQKWLGAEIETPQPQQPMKPPIQQAQPIPKPAPASPVTPFAPEASEATPTAEKSIVEQIDGILQEKLSNSPLMDRAIRLMESIDGGMVVYVGMDQYKDIDSIPDENIVAAIRTAVQEWESRQ